MCSYTVLTAHLQVIKYHKIINHSIQVFYRKNLDIYINYRISYI